MSRLFVLAVVCVALAAQGSSAQVCSLHRFIGDSPSDAQPGWHDEAQGLAHDADHWFVTQNKGDKTEATLWRIPVSINLATSVSCGVHGVSCSRLTETGLFPVYDHYGDPDYYEVNGVGYVLIPLEGRQAGTPPGVAIFRADATLRFLAFTPFPAQTGAPWVAVDAAGVLYSSNFQSSGLVRRYRLDWAAFQQNGEWLPPAALVTLPPLLLRDENGVRLWLANVQGGELSNDGRRLYVSSGDGKGDAEPFEGLHVLRVAEATGDACDGWPSPCPLAIRIERSHNSDDAGFSFEFHPGFPEYQEPEGLTYWDLDADGRAPGMKGQLHVVLLDNNIGPDEVYVKHYAFTDVDVDPPAVSCPLPVLLQCNSPGGLPATSPLLRTFFSSAFATDDCTSRPGLVHDAPAVFPLGTTPVTFTASDASGNAATCQAAVTIADRTPPVLTVTLSPSVLQPADGRVVPVTAQVGVADACGRATFTLVSIATNDRGYHGDVQDAELGTPDTSFLLRARPRHALQGQLEYRVAYEAYDSRGNTRRVTAVVRVAAANGS